MRVTELKALARDRGLRNYSRMRKHDGQKRNQMLPLGYNFMVLVHLLVD